DSASPSTATSWCARCRWRCASGPWMRNGWSASSTASCAGWKARARARSRRRSSARSSWTRSPTSTRSPMCASPRSTVTSARRRTSRSSLASSAPTLTEAKISPRDLAHMRAALGLAARGIGRTWPNPSVGCVLVREDGGSDCVVGRGWTQPGGRPHAETEALARAGEAARGATAYVTLEPCAHTGKTPPCADALIAAGIARAAVAVEDPDPRVSGRGLARLREAGVRVDLGVCAAEANELNAGFFLRVREGRPLVSLKLATSLDGRIATQSGESKWITGEAARRRAHLLRAQHDAIMVGTGTAKADDPELTSPLP